MIASSLLPIDKNTIKYGSNDGGATVKFEIEELNNAMAAAGDIQNLAPHEVGREGHPICGPGDIEAHLGHDGRYYVIDCARLMPPEAPPLEYFFYLLEYDYCFFIYLFINITILNWD